METPRPEGGGRPDALATLVSRTGASGYLDRRIDGAFRRRAGGRSPCSGMRRSPSRRAGAARAAPRAAEGVRSARRARRPSGHAAAPRRAATATRTSPVDFRFMRTSRLRTGRESTRPSGGRRLLATSVPDQGCSACVREPFRDCPGAVSVRMSDIDDGHAPRFARQGMTWNDVLSATALEQASLVRAVANAFGRPDRDVLSTRAAPGRGRTAPIGDGCGSLIPDKSPRIFAGEPRRGGQRGPQRAGPAGRLRVAVQIVGGVNFAGTFAHFDGAEEAEAATIS